MAGEQPRLDLSSCTQAVLAPGVLRAFGATHTSIGGAFSEIIDNFVDAGATYVDISLRKYRLPERPGQDDSGAARRRDVRQMLVISGDGKGCDARESLMVGRSEKNLAASRTIGGYGLGGQSSLMFLAEDALVLSMQAGGRATASLMSGTLHAEQGIADRLLTPHFAHRVPEGLLLPLGEEEDGEEYDSDYAPEPPDCEGDEAANLEAIYRYSPCRDWPALWRELAWFRRNKTKTGYRVLLYNLKNMSTTERPGDILGISDETDRSLRHVLRYKYLRPRLAVVLQGVKVLPVFWEGLLARATRETFQLGPNQITVLMGFNPSRAPGQRQHQLHSFLCVYVLGRLIRVYELRSELRLSSKGSAYGSGLCVIVDDTQGYLPLGMNKESVKAGAEFSTLKDELKERVKAFWKVSVGSKQRPLSSSESIAP